MKLLAEALGRGHAVNDRPHEAFDELRHCTAGAVADYSGITYERLVRGESLHWPCPAENHPGTPRLFVDRFPTADGRARFHAVEHGAPSEEPDDEYPYHLTTGRVLVHYQSGTQTRRVRSLNEAEPESFVEMHPQVGANHGVKDGERVWVRTRRGRALLKTRFNPTMRLDTLFVPFHWYGAGRANSLTGDALDPTSKIPDFKIAAAAVERVAPGATGDPLPTSET
jgi:assimilatory nitrate reductase catalytic subunit